MRSKLFYSVVLATSLFMYIVVLVVPLDAVLTGVLGMLVLPPIIWSADALGIVDSISAVPKAPPRHVRQYTLLRSKVRMLLDIAKRMNWLAVDLDRGVREEVDVAEEMDLATVRMKDLVDEIRDTAGRALASPDVLVPEEPLLDHDRRGEDRRDRETDAPDEVSEEE